MEPHQEILVVVADGVDFREAVEQWRRSGTVTQLLPPRLALLVPDTDPPPHVPGTRWYLDDVPADVLLDLAPHERIFVAAWRDRRARRGVAKDRPGDGVHWDTPGFQPPDAPPAAGPPPETDR
jgi:hypothetical protein